MSFSRQVLEQVRSQAVQTVIEANAQIADIDQTLAILDGATAAPTPPYDNGGHVNVGTVHVTNHGPAQPVVTPEQFEAALSPEVTAELKELFPGAAAPAPAPEQVEDELTFSAPPAPEPKTGGRRTNEEIAAEVGVNLEDVKEWKGGGRVSRADMEEFKKLHPAAIPGQQTIDDVDEPSLAEEEYNATIPGQVDADLGADLPAQAPSSYEAADEAVVADDAETFEPPF